MGCDIHLHTEVKLNGRWEHYGAPSITRQYDLFTLMAGVREASGVEAISEPRGLPEDCTYVTKFDSEKWGVDGHSHSYLTAEELVVVEEFMHEKLGKEFWRLERDEWGYLFGNGWSSFKKYPSDQPEGLEDVRFVFWFDN